MKRQATLLLLAALTLVAGGQGQAQDRYPSRSIRVVVPYGAGSATDITIRIVGEAVRKATGHGFVIENKPGAFGILAQEEMLKSPADGYTLQVGNAATNALAPIVYKSKYKFDYNKEITMVTRVGEIPLLLTGTTVDFPPKTFAEFVAHAKANPGKLRYASVGPGSNNHYDTEAIMRWAGIEVQHIPNKGGGGAITNDVLRGDVHVVLVNAASAAGLAQSGKIKVFAVIADKRLPDYPNVPTMKELGYASGEPLWSALYAPAKTPVPVLEAIQRIVADALKSQEVRETFGKQMINAIPNASLADAQAWNKSETERWRKVTEQIKIELSQ
jgi:tripartite-type tricarboxylate transporter receptor subunit TctC